jgi:ArsR family transcriptional regulator, arsenate/arsenite/antimonite-responsive transcriptional repressor
MIGFGKCAQALTDENRVMMLKLLTEKDICLCEMKEILPISQSQISRDLKILYSAGFLKRWREGKCVVYMADRTNSDGYRRGLLELVAASFNNDESVQVCREKLQTAIENRVREKSKERKRRPAA